MIAVEKQNNVKSSGIQNSVSFGIKKEGLAHIFNVLRNQLYSDKILAVVREYSCNAVDANVEAGNNNPIIVTLPTKLSPVFKVRDNGLGLTDKDIQEIYAFYGESTKRNSNALIGQLGLGSKAAFAYGDNFVIVSYVDGVKTSYNAFIDASQIGQIAKLNSEPTTEPNGIEISVPVKTNDCEIFKEKAESLFKYFKVKPLIKGQTLEYSAKTHILSGEYWGIYKNGGWHYSMTAVMGNIGYPIDLSVLPQNKSVENFRNISCITEIHFDIGDLEVSASRESLQYTDRTIKAIINKITAIEKEIAEILGNKIKEAKTYLQGKGIYGDIMDGGGLYFSFSPIFTSLKKDVIIDGRKIESSEVFLGESLSGAARVGSPESVTCKRYKKSRRSDRIVSENCGSIYFRCYWSTRNVLILNDMGHGSRISSRVHNLIKDGKKVFVISFKDDTTKQDWMKREGIQDSDFVLMSSLTPIALPKVARNVNPNRKKTNGSTFLFLTNPSNYFVRSSSWSAVNVDLDKDSGTYVEIDNFRINSPAFPSPLNLASLINRLSKVGVNIGDIHGFKVKIIEKVKKSKNWKPLLQHINEKIIDFLSNQKKLQGYTNWLSVGGANVFYSKMTPFIKDESFKDKNSTYLKLINFIKEVQSDKFDYEKFHSAIYSVSNTLVLPKPSFDVRASLLEINKKYPMFKIMLDRDHYYSVDKIDANIIIDYVNLVDKAS
jgi:hypothetical protein